MSALSSPWPNAMVKVFRDDPIWTMPDGSDRKWWSLPPGKARELLVAIYDLAHDEDGEYSGNWERDSSWLLAQHPSCVFVY